jgi:hypothetical protein
MKNILRIFLMTAVFGFFSIGCSDEEMFDIKNNGQNGANLYVTSAVKFFVGLDTDVNITYEKFENEGVTISTIDYTVVLSSTLGDSEAAAFSSPASASTITVAITDLLAALPVNGNTLTEGDLTPGDTFTFDFDITLADGRALDPPANTLVTVQCRPASGAYRVVMHDSYGDGWQTNDGNGGDGIQVTLDDGTVLEVGMCNPYVASPFTCPTPNDYSNAEDVINIPVGTEAADWYFPGDFYGEISFEIYSPTDVLIFNSGGTGATGAGILPIINCE